MTQDLLKLAHRRTPRYTSYPTAAQFSEAVGPSDAADWLAGLPGEKPLSLYLHVPFCRQICWYCACNMKLAAQETPLLRYTSDLMEEIKRVAEVFGIRKRIGHLHWGGGTPTALPEEALMRAMEAVTSRFDLDPGAEVAFEIDPRTFSRSMAGTLAMLGTTRVSFGVQEFDPHVQAAVNRLQPFSMVRETVDWIREAGIAKVNFDLMYGLPHQSVETLLKTIRLAVSLAPDRVALFGYAHVPWMAKRQRMIDPDVLPDAAERIRQAAAAAEALEAAGYRRIGLDHFARAGDNLVLAEQSGCLSRNFQGYTDDPAGMVVGLGATAISSLPQGIYQNIGETGAWARAIREGRLPVARGLKLTAEDRLRAEVISDLMCYLRVDLAEVLARHHRPASDFDRQLADCAEYARMGLVEIEERTIRVTEEGRPMVRIVASLFDAYLPGPEKAVRHAATV